MASAPESDDQHNPESLAHELLSRAHAPEIASTIHREKVKQRPLLLRPSSPDPTRDARSKRQYERHLKQKAQRKSNKPKPLSAKQKRTLCLYEIPKSQQKYSIYEGLHRLWCGYMREILDLQRNDSDEGRGRTWVDAAQVGPVLVSADYHGAEMEVVRSRCESLVGIKGIVVNDGKFAFEVVTRKDRVKCLPKRGSVFRFEVPFEDEDAKEGGRGGGGGGGEDREAESSQRDGEQMDDEKAKKTRREPLVFDIYGSQFEARAPDRANRKFRWHHDPDL